MNNIDQSQKYKELKQILSGKQRELKIRKERLQYNMIVGVCQKLLEQFAGIIENSGISLSDKKAEIMKNQVEFLGIQIDKSKVKMQQHIIQK